MRGYPFRRLLSVKVALLIGAVAAGAMCASPLLGVHGVESALVLGLLLPPFVAASTARLVHALREDNDVSARVPYDAFSIAFAAFAVPFTILALDAFRIPNCAPLEGVAFMVLGPGVAIFLAAMVGLVLGAIFSSARLATTLAFLVPIGFDALGVYRFWATPGIFSYAHFVGFFPGTIYDEGVSLPAPYLTFRLVSLAFFFGLLALFGALYDPFTARLSLPRARTAPVRFVLAGSLLALVLVADVFGHELGHRTTREHIAEELGATRYGERCIVHAPREMDRRELARLVDDCDFRVVRAERDLGVRHPRPITAFFFRDAEEKQRLMGAATTYIAKPWRDEVYLQVRAWPHPVLAHEIAHVVAASTASGPFRVGGSFDGWLPNPGLIEGVAVAVAWEPREELTPHQYARAMKELELLPPLTRIFGLGFLLQPARNAYTISGSFIRWLMDEHGARVVRQAYIHGDIERAVGKSLPELEREWIAFLDTVELPREAIELAKLRFSGRSIFSSVCPHELAKLGEELGLDLLAGDDRAALQTCREILAIEPGDDATRAIRAGALAREGRREDALRELAQLTDEPRAPEPVIVAAREGIADAAWRRGEREHAAQIYAELLEAPLADDQARQLEVKLLGLRAGLPVSALVRALLVGEDGRPPQPTVAMYLTDRIHDARIDGLGAYLTARQLHGARQFGRALPLFEEALMKSLPTPRLQREAERLLGECLYATGDLDRAAAFYWRLSQREDASMARRAEATDWMRRIRYVHTVSR